MGGVKSRLSTVYRRYQQLVIPFLVWSLIRILLNPPYQADAFIDAFLYPDGSFWFLWALFWISALFLFGDWIAEKLRMKQEWITAILCIVLIAVMIIGDVRILGYQFIAYYFLFFSLGYYLNKYRERIVWKTWIMVSLHLLWAILAWFWRMHGVPSFLQGLPLSETLTNYAYRFLTAAIAVYLLFGVSPLVLNYEEGKDKLLMFAGQWSLGIYTVHLLLMPFICDALHLNWLEFATTFMAFIVALSFSLVFVYILSKNRITKKIMLGKT